MAKQQLAPTPILVAPPTVRTRIGTLSFTHDFENGYPTIETQQKLLEEMDFQRATQAYLWGLPIVAFARWQYSHETELGAGSGDVVFYGSLEDKYGLMSGDVRTPYVASFIDLRETGPIVIEIPRARLRGAAYSMWQTAFTPVADAATCVFYAPDTAAPDVKDARVVETPTNSFFFGVHLLAGSPAARSRDLAGIRIYRLSEMGDPPPTRIIEVARRLWRGWQPRGLAYFETLADILAREPVAERDRFFMAMLKPLGIEKGKPFAPTEFQRKILTEAALVGEAMAKANAFSNPRLERSLALGDSAWEVATTSPTEQRWEDSEALDGRAAWFYRAVTNEPAAAPGAGQICLSTCRDSDGDWLDGGTSYTLTIPAQVPAADFWSLTLYDVATRTPIRNPQRVADKSSRVELGVNADGSVTLYLGPKSPEMGTMNWIPTMPGRAWFPYFRLHSPTEAWFDRRWVLPDIEKRR